MSARHLIVVLAALLSAPSAMAAEDFFPIGMFSVGPQGLASVKAAGFNTAHSYITDGRTLEQMLASAEKLGLKLLIYPSSGADRCTFDAEGAEQFIRRNRQASALLGWFLADEPELAGCESATLERNAHDITTSDPDHPTAVVIHRMDKYREYQKAADILLVDRYPVPRTPIKEVGEAVRWAKESAKKRIWAVIQAYGFQSDRLKGWGAREPTYEEMRAMTWLAITGGASGIFYFTYTGSQYRIAESPTHWQDLQRIVRELNRYYPLLLAAEEDSSVAVAIEAGKLGESAEAGDIVSSTRRLVRGSDNLPAGLYAIVVNSSPRNIQAKVSFPPAPSGTQVFRLEGESATEVRCKDRACAEQFGPYSIHVYRTGD